MRNMIIDYIKRNKVSTTEVADCLGKRGVLEGCFPINSRHFRVGIIKWIYAYNESNWDVHEQIRNIDEGTVVLIEAFECNNRAIIGDLVSKYILLYKQAAAIVTMGRMRDAHNLIKENYPIWCKGVSPVGCFNTKNEYDLSEEIKTNHYMMYDGAIAVCDDSGVVVIPKEYHTKEFLNKLEFIEQQEDIWYDCLDRKGWDTFQIVCKKEYLDNGII